MVKYASMLLFFSAFFVDCLGVETRKKSGKNVTCCATPKDKYSESRDGFGFVGLAEREVNIAGLVYNKDLEALAEYLKTHDINAQVNCYGEALLHLAIRYRHIDVVTWLLKQPNIDPDARMHNKGATLHAALTHGFFPETVEMVRLLVAAGASANLQNMCGRSALEIAQCKEMFNPKARKLLIEQLKKADDIDSQQACNNLGAAIEQELAREQERLVHKENQKARRMVQHIMSRTRTRLATVGDEESTFDAGDLQTMVTFEQRGTRRNAPQQVLQAEEEEYIPEAVAEAQIPTSQRKRKRAIAPQGSSPLAKCSPAKTEEAYSFSLDDAGDEAADQDAPLEPVCQIEIFTEACAASYDSSMLSYSSPTFPHNEERQTSNYVDSWYGLGQDPSLPDFLMCDQSQMPRVQ